MFRTLVRSFAVRFVNCIQCRAGKVVCLDSQRPIRRWGLNIQVCMGVMDALLQPEMLILACGVQNVACDEQFLWWLCSREYGYGPCAEGRWLCTADNASAGVLKQIGVVACLASGLPTRPSFGTRWPGYWLICCAQDLNLRTPK